MALLYNGNVLQASREDAVRSGAEGKDARHPVIQSLRAMSKSGQIDARE
jgi:hypothetical protein